MRYTTPTQFWKEERARDPKFPLGLGYLRKAVADGTIPSIQVGRKRVFDADRIAEYLEQQQPGKVRRV